MEPKPEPKPSPTERLKTLLSEYGPVAFVVYFAVFSVVLLGFAIAISVGFETESTAGGVGTLTAAWIATKVTQPLRIAATLVLTPLAGLALKKLRRPSPDGDPGAKQPPE